MPGEALPCAPRSDIIEEPSTGMRIVMPTLSRIRETMRRKLIAHMWVNARIDQKRAGMRPSFSTLYGEGTDFTMPLAAGWLSSGPDADDDESNIIVFPSGADTSVAGYMQKIGLLGRHVFTDFQRLPQLAMDTDRLIYNVDELPRAWDTISANTAGTMRIVNTKKYLNWLTRYPAPFTIVDLRYTSPEDFDAFDGQTLFVKLNNTEASGIGVHICTTREEYRTLVQKLLMDAKTYRLDYDVVLQPEIRGENRSFQYIVHPDHPSRLQLLTISEQRVADDGKTYESSVNPPLHPRDISPQIARLMTDNFHRIRGIDSAAFGCVMCDYFKLPDDRLLAFDPGLRPTGNTAAAIARLFIQEKTGTPMFSMLFAVNSKKPETAFKDYIKPIDALMGPDAAVNDGSCILPWGYNHIGGNGLLIAVSRSTEEMNAIKDEATATLTS